MTQKLLVILTVLSIYLLRLNRVAGMMVDDAWYVLLAKSLAQGTGYVLISAPQALLPLYPPGFPALLSPVFWLASSFPANVIWLKAVSIGAMAGTGLLSYRYLHHVRQVSRQLALLAAMAVTVTPAFVFLATSTVMSECVFTFAQIATVVLLHASAQARPPSRGRLTVLAALGGSAAVLIRSAGIAVPIAGVLWMISRREWRRAAAFASVVAISLAPWFSYARAHKPTPTEQENHRGSIVFAYDDQFWMRWAGSPSSGVATARDLPRRVWVNITDVAGRDMIGIFAPSLLRGPSESGEEIVALGTTAGLSAASMGGATGTLIISTVLGLVVLVGFVRVARHEMTASEWLVPISLCITLLWPFWSFRFVLPLTPFLFLYLIRGVEILTAKAAHDPLRIPRLVLASLLGLVLLDHAAHIALVRDSSARQNAEWLARSGDVEAALTWMDHHLERDGLVATTNPALVYLRTGRKAITLDTVASQWKTWKRLGVRYVACFLPADLPPETLGTYKVLYQSSSRIWVIEI